MGPRCIVAAAILKRKVVALRYSGFNPLARFIFLFVVLVALIVVNADAVKPLPRMLVSLVLSLTMPFLAVYLGDVTLLVIGQHGELT